MSHAAIAQRNTSKDEHSERGNIMKIASVFWWRMTTTTVVLTLVALTAGAGETLMRDDFDNQPEQRWRFVSDRVMGGISNGNVIFDRIGGDSIAHMTGVVSTANNGGFIQFRRNIEAPQGALGVVLRVRGNGENYFLHARTRAARLPWHYYRAGFDTTSEWREVRLPFAGFLPSSDRLKGGLQAASIRSLGIVAYGREHRADIQVAWLGFY